MTSVNDREYSDAVARGDREAAQAEKKMAEALPKLTAAQNGSELREILRALFLVDALAADVLGRQSKTQHAGA